MERQSQQPNGGEKQPGPTEHAQSAPPEHDSASHQLPENAERERFARQQREQAATRQAEGHTEDLPIERKIRASLYLARMEGRPIDDVTARRIAAELGPVEGSALERLATSGAIEPDPLLHELAARPDERSWRAHWLDALTQYVLNQGERGPVPDWAESATDNSPPWDPNEQVGDIYEVDVGPTGIERAERLRTPRIYVACLSSHDEGIQHGLWIDADQEAEELQADIQAMLASSPAVGAEEYAIHDYDGFRGFEVSEHEDLAVVSRVAHGIAGHGEAFAVFVARAGTSEDAARSFHELYVGTFTSPEDWARQIAIDLEWHRQIEERLEPDLAPYVAIDYQALAREMANYWQVVEGAEGTHVFAQ